MRKHPVEFPSGIAEDVVNFVRQKISSLESS